MCASDSSAREGSPFGFAHLAPGTHPNSFKEPIRVGTDCAYFVISRVDDPGKAHIARLEFVLSAADGRVLITPSYTGPYIPDSVDLDEITVNLAEEIASEVMIQVLNAYSY